MKKLLALLLLCISTVEMPAQTVTKNVIIGDPAKKGQYQYSSLAVTNGNLIINGTMTATNGAVISGGTVDWTGVTSFTIPAAIIPAAAIPHITISAGAADAGKYVILDGTGKFDSSVIPTAGATGITSTNMYSNDLTPDTTFQTVFSYTTTKGAGALLRVYAQGGSASGHWVNIKLVADGVEYYGAPSPRGAAGQNGLATLMQDLVLTTNTTVVVKFQGESSNIVRNFIYSAPTFIGSNSFRAFFTEIK